MLTVCLEGISTLMLVLPYIKGRLFMDRGLINIELSLPSKWWISVLLKYWYRNCADVDWLTFKIFSKRRNLRKQIWNIIETLRWSCAELTTAVIITFKILSDYGEKVEKKTHQNMKYDSVVKRLGRVRIFYVVILIEYKRLVQISISSCI